MFRCSWRPEHSREMDRTHATRVCSRVGGYEQDVDVVKTVFLMLFKIRVNPNMFLPAPSNRWFLDTPFTSKRLFIIFIGTSWMVLVYTACQTVCWVLNELSHRSYLRTSTDDHGPYTIHCSARNLNCLQASRLAAAGCKTKGPPRVVLANVESSLTQRTQASKRSWPDPAPPPKKKDPSTL